MKLYLIRHAVAGDPDSRTWPDDSQGPLTKRGSRRFRKAARGLRRFTRVPDVVVSSPYIRAEETAWILQGDAGWPAPSLDERLASADPGAALEALKQRLLGSVAFVGHEPQISRFAALLISADDSAQIEMKKGAAACIEVESLSPEVRGRLLWLLPPRALRDLA